MNTHNTLVDNLQAFRLKGRMQPLTVMQCLSLDVGRVRAQLRSMIEQAPKLFENALILLDFSQYPDVPMLDELQAVLLELKAHGLLPIGLCHLDAAVNDSLSELGLPILASSHADKAQPIEIAQHKPTQIIHRPVRSGQQIYAKQADLVVIGSVSAGAEVMADGNIHIYGALNGRALAGVNDNPNAQIFCQRLNPELVAIAGQYCLPDEMPPYPTDQAVRVFLEAGRLRLGTVLTIS